MPIIFYSLITIFATGLVSLGLLFRLRKDHLLVSRPFYWHWVIGFALFALVHLPVLFINLGGYLSYNYYKVVCVFMVFTAFVSHLLFYRAVTIFLTKSKFWLNKFPVIIFLAIFGLLLILCLSFNVPMFIIMTIFVLSFILPMSLYLTGVFFYLHIRSCSWDGDKKRPSAILLSLAWFFTSVLVIIWWIISYKYGGDFWILKLASFKIWYLARAAVHLLMLAGFLVYTKSCWQHPKVIEKNGENTQK